MHLIEFSTTNSLQTFLGLSDAELKKIQYFKGEMYNTFSIEKKEGKGVKLTHRMLD